MQQLSDCRLSVIETARTEPSSFTRTLFCMKTITNRFSWAAATYNISMFFGALAALGFQAAYGGTCLPTFRDRQKKASSVSRQKPEIPHFTCLLEVTNIWESKGSVCSTCFISGVLQPNIRFNVSKLAWEHTKQTHNWNNVSVRLCNLWKHGMDFDEIWY